MTLKEYYRVCDAEQHQTECLRASERIDKARVIAKRELAATMARLRDAIAGEVDEVAEGDIADDWQATLDRIDDLVSEECWDAVSKINEGAGR
jgi:hypothetical protein